MKPCFGRCDILLPDASIDFSKWPVVACDQYTSQPEYWKNVESIVSSNPSSLHMIYPEVYLEEKSNRIDKIHQTMNEYYTNHILTKQVSDGFVLVNRKSTSGEHLGLIGVIDLEAYEYTPGNSALIRATEGTIESRIPPRIKVRNGALLESTHVMLLIDDPECELIESVYENKESLRLLYDTELMLNGGHICGYAIEGENAIKLEKKIKEMEDKSNGFFLCVGDGNHSLATAKTYWSELKKTLPEEIKENHPARYALVELVNLHNSAIQFEPIHRIVFDSDAEKIFEAFCDEMKSYNIEIEEGHDIVFIDKSNRKSLSIKNPQGKLPLDYLQKFLDQYIERNKLKLDYIHGEDSINELIRKYSACGILVESIQKDTLFSSIVAGGVLPRKSFSMGEPFEKRYYIECRKIK